MASDTNPRGISQKLLKENNLLKQEIKFLKQNVADKEYLLKTSNSECDNMELAYKRALHAKAELNDKVEQLTDDVRKFEELYVRAKGVAQALGKAVSILTTEVQNG